MEVPELIERISLGVPPNELGVYPNIKLPSWQSALSSSGICKIHGSNYDKQGNAQDFSLNDFHKLNKICLRAIEGIELHRNYLEHLASGS